MRKRTTALRLLTLTAMVMMTFVVSLVLQTTFAPKLEAAESVNYDVNTSLAENLKSFTGKRVSLTLSSGNILTGVVKAVGKNLVHLEKLQGKDFFDALIRIEKICAIDTRFRK